MEPLHDEAMAMLGKCIWDGMEIPDDGSFGLLHQLLERQMHRTQAASLRLRVKRGFS